MHIEEFINVNLAALIFSFLLIACSTFFIFKGKHRNKEACIYLVGGGPGNSDLMTVKAVKLCESADVVVVDRLIPPEIIILCQGTVIYAPEKRKGKSDESQDEINEVCLTALREGKSVVRLKIGDPFVFGRGGEEVLFFRSHGFQCEVVPGVSSAFAAPLFAGIPVTMRDYADQVLILTARGKDGAFPDIPIYNKGRTLVFLMCKARLPILFSEMSIYGYPNTLPCAIIENSTLENERVFICSLSNLGKCANDNNVVEPVVLVVGHVVLALRENSSKGNENENLEIGEGNERNEHVPTLKGYKESIEKIKNVQKDDPYKDDNGLSKDILIGERVEKWMSLILKETEVTDISRLACRCKYMERWIVERGTESYSEWQIKLKERQGVRVREILKGTVDANTLEQVVELVVMDEDKIRSNILAKAIQDGECLEFLNSTLSESSEKYNKEEVASLIKINWNKMSNKAHMLAVQLDLSSDVIFLMAQALLPDMDQKALELEEINVEAGKTKNNQPAKVEEEEE